MVSRGNWEVQNMSLKTSQPTFNLPLSLLSLLSNRVLICKMEIKPHRVPVSIKWGDTYQGPSGVLNTEQVTSMSFVPSLFSLRTS